MLEVKNICAGYDKKQVLQNISAEFESGKFTAIIGPNGCGKSTLLKAVSGILPINEGAVMFDGVNLSEMTKKQTAQKISYLEQGKTTPDMTVEQLVLHGRFPYLAYPRRYKKSDKAIALSAMEEMGVDKYAKYPIASLSGGLKQMTYIAMALCQNTDFILLDEPTAYLDIKNSLKLLGTLNKLKTMKKGIVAVLHDLVLALRYADEIMVIENGKIRICATAEEVYNSKIIEDVFGVTLKKAESGQGNFYISEMRNKEE